jgi:hypothetical protein
MVVVVVVVVVVLFGVHVPQLSPLIHTLCTLRGLNSSKCSGPISLHRAIPSFCFKAFIHILFRHFSAQLVPPFFFSPSLPVRTCLPPNKFAPPNNLRLLVASITMASQSRHGVYPDEKKSSQSGKSPAQTSKPNRQSAADKAKSLAYTSEGVGDNDIFQFSASDWQLLGVITLLGAVVRLFRIQQPTSVVFDEVQ